MSRNLRIRFSSACNAVLLGAVLLVSGCGKSRVRSVMQVPQETFKYSVIHSNMTVYARMCSHDEIASAFNRVDDFYHYYHLLHVRCVNAGYLRYTLQTDGCSFFVPPSEFLRPYTNRVTSGFGALVSFLNALIGFPIYAISMLKAAVETPPYLLEPELVVPRSFGVLSIMYAGVVIAPLVLGWLYEKSVNGSSFAHADTCIMTQNQQHSIPPFATEDMLIITPRAGFTSPCTLAFYNHQTGEQEKVSIIVPQVW